MLLAKDQVHGFDLWYLKKKKKKKNKQTNKQITNSITTWKTTCNVNFPYWAYNYKIWFFVCDKLWIFLS